MDVLNESGCRTKNSTTDVVADVLRLIDRDDVMWSDTVHYRDRPVLAAECRDERIIDRDGNVYIDTQMWHSTCNFGYGNKAVVDAMHTQLDKLPQVSGDLLHEEKLLLAKEIADSVQERFGVRGRVSFNVSGTLLVEDAIKIARRTSGRQVIAAFMGGYHGRSLAVSAISSSQRYRAPFGAFADRAVLYPFADCATCYYEMEPSTCHTFCARPITRSLTNEFYGLVSERGTDLAALIFEVCQGRSYAVPPATFLCQVVPAFQNRGILAIDDEIQAGMYRTGTMFAAEQFGVVPDIILLGKSLTNGMSPLGAVWAREDLVDPATFGPGHNHSNFANHSLGTAAALATLRYARKRNYLASVPAAGEYYLARLRDLQKTHPSIGEVSGLGLMLRISLRDRRRRWWRGGAKLAAQLGQDHDIHYGGERLRLIINSGGYDGEVIKLAPWLDISTTGMDRHAALLDAVLDRLEATREWHDS
jgi:4-aminobutyrate aminotransferase / (S)-3-amino-2-methylpropionate transaminase / 5-aminovalerate transaminase